MEKKIRKGDLVRVNEARCFTRQNGGTRPYPLTNGRDDQNRVIRGRYIRTADDDRKWREEKRKATEEAIAKGEDTFSINFNDAGEKSLLSWGVYRLWDWTKTDWVNSADLLKHDPDFERSLNFGNQYRFIVARFDPNDDGDHGPKRRKVELAPASVRLMTASEVGNDSKMALH